MIKPVKLDPIIDLRGALRTVFRGLPVTLLRALGVFALLLALGCDAEERVLGSWEVATIDGVVLNAAVPLRVAFPAGAYGQVILAEGQRWKEYTLESLVLELMPGGAFREQTVEAANSAVSRSTYDRPAYVGLFGGELIREDRRPGKHEVIGTWTLAGGSLALFVTRDTAVAAAAAHLEEVMPTASESDILAALDQALPRDMPLRWSGRLRGDRLELLDAEGRAFTLRKTAVDGASAR